MTHDRDIERVLERWLADGPTEMPTASSTSIVDRVEPPAPAARVAPPLEGST